MKPRALSAPLLAGVALFLSSCDTQKVTGTADETNASAARLLDSTGAAVAGASIYVFERNDSTQQAVTTGTTLQDGSYSLPEVATGLYRVIVRSQGRIAVLDSVYTSSGKLQVRTDTLHAAGTLTGHVVLVGDDNPASVSIRVLGSDYETSVNSNGSFNLNGLGKGTWRLKFVSSLEEYSATYATATTRASAADTLDTVAMNFVGIPPVTNLKAVYDTLTGRVRLTWKLPTSTGSIRDIQILRVLRSSTADPSVIGSAGASDTSYTDTLCTLPGINPNVSTTDTSSTATPSDWLYNVRIRTNDSRTGRVAYTAIQTVSPWAIVPVVTIQEGVRGRDTAYAALSVHSHNLLTRIDWTAPGLLVGTKTLTPHSNTVLDTVWTILANVDTSKFSTAISAKLRDTLGHEFAFTVGTDSIAWRIRNAVVQAGDTSIGKVSDSTTTDSARTTVDSTKKDSSSATTTKTDSARTDSSTSHRDSTVSFRGHGDAYRHEVAALVEIGRKESSVERILAREENVVVRALKEERFL
jgi:hypothetical protein